MYSALFKVAAETIEPEILTGFRLATYVIFPVLPTFVNIERICVSASLGINL
jgi:hypothetical protein